MKTRILLLSLLVLGCVSGWAANPPVVMSIQLQGFGVVQVSARVPMEHLGLPVQFETAPVVEGPWVSSFFSPILINDEFVIHDSNHGFQQFYRVAVGFPPFLYSSNIVGYMNLLMPTGSNSVVMPFAGPLPVEALSVPEDACVFKTNGMGSCYSFGFWDPEGVTLETGERFELNAPQPFTLTLAGEVPQRPVILWDPASQTVRVGDYASFFVIQLGLPGMTYEWRRNGVVLPGETFQSLYLPDVMTAQAGQYTVAVSNEFGGTVSAPAELTVLPRPVLSQAAKPVDGEFRFTVSGIITERCAIEASSFLTNDWTQVALLTATNGVVEFVETPGGATSKRFFRAREMP